MSQQIVEFACLFANQMSKYLALAAIGQIRTRRRRGQIELRGISRVLGHGALSASDKLHCSIALPGLTVNPGCRDINSFHVVPQLSQDPNC